MVTSDASCAIIDVHLDILVDFRLLAADAADEIATISGGSRLMCRFRRVLANQWITAFQRKPLVATWFRFAALSGVHRSHRVAENQAPIDIVLPDFQSLAVDLRGAWLQPSPNPF